MSNLREEADEAVVHLLAARGRAAELARGDNPGFGAGDPTNLYARAVLKISEAIGIIESAEMIRLYQRPAPAEDPR